MFWRERLNKSLTTNLIAAVLVIIGYLLPEPIILSIGLFALSGAVTNWLAIHMLFEKVPGLYGSGVVPSRFEEFKAGISHLMMKQFFTSENIERFISGQSEHTAPLNLAPVIEQVDLSPAFDGLVTTVENSQLGGMLAMFGGSEAIMPLKEPFIEKMKSALADIAKSDDFHHVLQAQLSDSHMSADLQVQIEDIVNQRLNELTPQLVKQIIQDMIKTHLGWLVVWGGVFGGAIGLIAAVLPV